MPLVPAPSSSMALMQTTAKGAPGSLCRNNGSFNFNDNLPGSRPIARLWAHAPLNEGSNALRALPWPASHRAKVFAASAHANLLAGRLVGSTQAAQLLHICSAA